MYLMSCLVTPPIRVKNLSYTTPGTCPVVRGKLCSKALSCILHPQASDLVYFILQNYLQSWTSDQTYFLCLRVHQLSWFGSDLASILDIFSPYIIFPVYLWIRGILKWMLAVFDADVPMTKIQKVDEEEGSLCTRLWPWPLSCVCAVMDYL